MTNILVIINKLRCKIFNLFKLFNQVLVFFLNHLYFIGH